MGASAVQQQEYRDERLAEVTHQEAPAGHDQQCRQNMIVGVIRSVALALRICQSPEGHTQPQIMGEKMACAAEKESASSRCCPYVDSGSRFSASPRRMPKIMSTMIRFHSWVQARVWACMVC